MNPLIQLKHVIPAFLIAFSLACIALLPKVLAVVPPPDGGYPGFNTAEGQNALFSLTTGVGNAAVGWFSLFNNTDGSFNTALGAGTLLFNVGDQSTGDGTQNTAVGAAALLLNTTGFHNTATGSAALLNNTTGSRNTATGYRALMNNSGGDQNTANGLNALLNNTAGNSNTVIGNGALANNTIGNGNIALGLAAGSGVTTASNVICIGTAVGGANVDDTCYIGNIFGATSASGTAVFINSEGRLGTTTSSLRFKEDINPMNKASEAVLALKPVTFRYKKDIDPAGTSQFGLVAEEVEKVNPDLIVRDKEGKPYSVRYDQVNAMLLNEFLKEHKKVEEQQATIAELKSTVAQQQKGFESKLAEQQKQIEALTAGLQKVSAQLEASRHAPQVVENNR